MSLWVDSYRIQVVSRKFQTILSTGQAKKKKNFIKQGKYEKQTHPGEIIDSMFKKKKR